MSNSLRDQLLNTGLVSQKQARNAENQAKLKAHQQKKKKKKKPNKAPDTESVAYEAAKAREEEIARAKELNRQKEIERQQKALQAQVRDIIERHQVNDPDASTAYNFTDGKFVKQIHVNAKQQQQVANGQLAITKLEDSYYLVPDTVVSALLERMPETIVYYINKDEQTTEADDLYADYKVPDDLMW